MEIEPRGVIARKEERIEEVIEPKDLACDCGAERHVIGEDVSERLDIVPAQFRVIVTGRPRAMPAALARAISRKPRPKRG